MITYRRMLLACLVAALVGAYLLISSVIGLQAQLPAGQNWPLALTGGIWDAVSTTMTAIWAWLAQLPAVVAGVLR